MEQLQLLGKALASYLMFSKVQSRLGTPTVPPLLWVRELREWVDLPSCLGLSRT